MWSSGDVVVRRNVWRGRIFSAAAAIVVADRGDELVTCILEGAERWEPRGGQRLPTEWELEETTWRGPATVTVHGDGARHALVHFFDANGAFRGWYANLEEPVVRTRLGYDIRDNLLDLWRPVDGDWQWKDEEELEEGVAAGVISAAQAAQIRADGERVLRDVRLPTGWESWRPDPAWTPPRLPRGWREL